MNARLLVSLACLTVITVGCEPDDDTVDGRSHQPPTGAGAIVVENDTESEWNTSVDGVLLGRVASRSFLVSDAAPGKHPVHLDQHLGSDKLDRTVDVSEGLLTVIRISFEAFDDIEVDVFQIAPAS